MSVYKFKMNGVFASELESMLFGDDDLITYKKTESELQQANGKDIEVDLSSVGGLVDVGVDIFFMFRDYKRQYPTAQMQLNIKSQAASMASMFSSGEFWDLVTVEDISSFMVHNPANGMWGDYNEMYKNAEYLERLSKLYAGVYAKRSKKTDKEVRKMMDETTFLFGEEIVKNGFADEIMKTDKDKDRDSYFAQMELKYKSTMEKLETVRMQRKDIEKAVALLQTQEKEESTQPATGGNNNQEAVKMKFDEVKTTFSSELAGIEKAGEDKGKADMIANNKAIMEFKNKDEYKNLVFVQERCEKALMEGESLADLKMSVQALMLDPKNQAHMESPGNINTGMQKTVSGEVSGFEAEDKGL